MALTTTQRTEGLNSMESVSLEKLAEEKLAEAQQAHSGRAAHTIYGGATRRLRQTLVALRAGQQLAEHDSPGESTLQVLRGKVRLTAGDEAPPYPCSVSCWASCPATVGV